MEKRGKIQILSEFMEGLNTCADAASQMVHQHANPKWIAVRDMINIIRDGVSAKVASGFHK